MTLTIRSGWMPGKPNDFRYFFSTDLLSLWFHLKHNTPGTSESKFVETLSELSTHHGRVSKETFQLFLNTLNNSCTFSITLLIGLYSQLSNCKFFCYDVICQYWKFAVDVGSKIERFKPMTEKMKPFLSRWHGLTHTWYCQVRSHLD